MRKKPDNFVVATADICPHGVSSSMCDYCIAAQTNRNQVSIINELRSKLSAAEKERDSLKAKLSVAVEALKTMSRVTYGTELCNSDEENNEILANNFFRHQKIAREALKAIDGGKL